MQYVLLFMVCFSTGWTSDSGRVSEKKICEPNLNKPKNQNLTAVYTVTLVRRFYDHLSIFLFFKFNGRRNELCQWSLFHWSLPHTFIILLPLLPSFICLSVPLRFFFPLLPTSSYLPPAVCKPAEPIRTSRAGQGGGLFFFLSFFAVILLSCGCFNLLLPPEKGAQVAAWPPPQRSQWVGFGERWFFWGDHHYHHSLLLNPCLSLSKSQLATLTEKVKSSQVKSS